jgi:type I restriction-modification system DNA methylase subunit
VITRKILFTIRASRIGFKQDTMTDLDQKQLGKTLWNIADTLRGAMNADDFRDYMLSFLFLRYLSDNYEAAAKKELAADYPDPNAISNGGKTPLSVWYADNPDDVAAFEKQMRRKVHYVVEPHYLWGNIVHLAKTQNRDLLDTLQKGFKHIEAIAGSRARRWPKTCDSRPTAWRPRARPISPSCSTVCTT